MTLSLGINLWRRKKSLKIRASSMNVFFAFNYFHKKKHLISNHHKILTLFQKKNPRDFYPLPPQKKFHQLIRKIQNVQKPNFPMNHFFRL